MSNEPQPPETAARVVTLNIFELGLLYGMVGRFMTDNKIDPEHPRHAVARLAAKLWDAAEPEKLDR